MEAEACLRRARELVASGFSIVLAKRMERGRRVFCEPQHPEADAFSIQAAIERSSPDVFTQMAALDVLDALAGGLDVDGAPVYERIEFTQKKALDLLDEAIICMSAGTSV